MRFLKNSAAAFDAGDHLEAVRIAGPLAMLLFDGKTNGVVTEIGGTDIELTSTAFSMSAEMEKLMPIGATVAAWGGSLLSIQQFQLSSSSASGNHIPLCLDPRWDKRQRQVPRAEWWSERIHSHPSMIRGELIRIVRDKDGGGGHIDTKLPDGYAQMKGGIITVERRSAAGDLLETFTLPDLHLADLRQMAWEILNSPNLLALLAD